MFQSDVLLCCHNISFCVDFCDELFQHSALLLPLRILCIYLPATSKMIFHSPLLTSPKRCHRLLYLGFGLTNFAKKALFIQINVGIISPLLILSYLTFTCMKEGSCASFDRGILLSTHKCTYKYTYRLRVLNLANYPLFAKNCIR